MFKKIADMVGFNHSVFSGAMDVIAIKDKNGEIKGTMSILLRKVPVINRHIMYAPRGFVCDIHDKETLKELTQKARRNSQKI